MSHGTHKKVKASAHISIAPSLCACVHVRVCAYRKMREGGGGVKMEGERSE